MIWSCKIAYHMMRPAGKPESRSVPGTRISAYEGGSVAVRTFNQPQDPERYERTQHVSMSQETLHNFRPVSPQRTLLVFCSLLGTSQKLASGSSLRFLSSVSLQQGGGPRGWSFSDGSFSEAIPQRVSDVGSGGRVLTLKGPAKNP